MSASLAGLVVGTTGVAVSERVYAQEMAPRAAELTRSYNIPAGALDQVLNRFAAAAGIYLSVDSALTRGKTSPGLTGDFTIEQGFVQLLSGQGLQVVRGDNDAYSLRAAPVEGAVMLPSVKVRAAPEAATAELPAPYAGGQVARGADLGLLGTRDMMDTPFSQTSYTAQMIQDTQARSVADVLANNPSVRNVWPAVSYTGSFNVRGFPVSNQDVAYGGLYGVVPALTVATELLERVEILEGPSALLTGMAPFGSIGGLVNVVPKRAADQPLTEVTADYVSDSEFGGHLDVGRRFGSDGQYGVRFNGVFREGDTAVEHQSQEMGAAALGLDYRGESLRLSLDLGFQKQEVDAPLRPTYVDAGVSVPRAPKATSNWFQPWSYVDTQDDFGALHGEYDLSPDWTVFAAVGGRRDLFNAVTGFATVSNANGDLTDAPFYFPEYSDTDTEEAGIRGHFDTGPVHNQVSLSGSRFHLDFGDLFPVIATVQSNLYNPTFITEPNITERHVPQTEGIDLSSVAFADVLSALDERIQLIGGLRSQRVREENFSSTDGSRTSYYDQVALSPAGGLVLKPWRNVSLYANYIQGLQAGSSAPTGTLNAGQVFAPFKSTQYEAGAKVDLGKLTGTFAVFQIEQPSGTTDPATKIYSIAGQQRNRGVELNLFGQVIDTVRLLGGVSYLDGILTSTAGGTDDGKTATGVAHVQANFGEEWDTPFVPGLTLSERTVYTSSQFLDVANTQRIPGWVRFDVGARYKLTSGGKPVTVRADVENVGGANYWAAASSTYGLVMGAPRTFLLSATVDF